MKPLEGIRVLDLGIITAGAATSAMLCDLGAEVLKVESPTYKDPFRVWVALSPADKDKLSPHFGATNRGKKALALNIKDDEGRRHFLALVAEADVVVENFSRGVLAKLGIGFEVLKAANPNIVLASISSQGETGPTADHVSYGSTLECVAGLAWHLGYDGGGPMVSGVDINYPDQVVAIFSAGMIVSALSAVRDGAGAVHLDLSQRELTSYLIGEVFAEPELPPQRGNADAAYLIQDCFRAADGRWVAISVRRGQQRALTAVLGGSRREELAGWVLARDADVAAHGLTEVGIAAAPSLTGPEVLAARRWSAAMIEGPDGALWKGAPFDLGAPLNHRPIGPFGADTVEILGTLGRCDAEKIAHLVAVGTIVAADAH